MKKTLEQQEAIRTLKKILKPGDTLFCTLKDCNAMGDWRTIDVHTFRGSRKNPDVRWLSRLICKACDFKFDEKRNGVRINGGGMDMGFEIVYTLGHYLWPKGFTPKTAGMSGRNGVDASVKDPNGGYALRHRWL